MKTFLPILITMVILTWSPVVLLAQPLQDTARYFDRIDTDGDGRISPSELPSLAPLDADRDGFLSRDEFDESQRRRIARGFAYLDENRDGKVTRVEFYRLGEIRPIYQDIARVDAFFKNLDSNADQSLSIREFGAILLTEKTTEPAALPAPKPEDITFFEKRIRPVLAESCYECHSASSEKIKGGLLLDTREGIRRGGDLGPTIIPGNLEASLLLESIRYENEDLQMPPTNHGGKLSKAVISDFEQWIRMGAPDPRDGKSSPTRYEWNTEEALSHWAFQPLQKKDAPDVKQEDWPLADLDRHVLSTLEEKGLAPVGDAEREVWLRRVTFDLIGLPPTPGELEKFLSDQSPDPYGNVADRLLESPRFGERWGRHWLDVARYAESTGRDVNATLPHAWRYRDFVIDSFNADKPFDQFLREQIAGDLLPAGTDRQRAEQLVATGFLALGTRGLNERDPKQFALDLADEQIDTVSQAILGLTVSCARCHDHKFDPIPQSDYYALAGIFLSTDTLYGVAPSFQAVHPAGLIELPNHPGLPQLPWSLSTEEREEKEGELEKLRRASQRLFIALYSPGSSYLPEGGLRNDPERLIQVRAMTTRIGQLERELEIHDDEGCPRALAPGVQDQPVEKPISDFSRGRSFQEILESYSARPPEFRAIGDSPLFVRGDSAQPAALVPRGFLSALGDASGFEIPADESGRRQLADWFVSPENPLTARVFVNRVWHWLFGRGLVESVDNFGLSGQSPTNSALLDHLAAEFRNEGWSVKSLIREIVKSRTYRLASDYHEASYLADPENTLLWRHSPRRLDAECIRDAMLAVAGNLDTERPLGSEVARVGDATIGGLGFKSLRAPLGDEPFITAANRHRSVYLPVVRNALPESLAIFDFAEPNTVVGKRDTTTVPAQALYLLNNAFVADQALTFAHRLLHLEADIRVEQAFLHAFGRLPSLKEQEAARHFFHQFPVNEDGEGEIAAWTSFCRALFCSAEFRMID